MKSPRTVSPVVAVLVILGTVAGLAVLGVTPLGGFVLSPAFVTVLVAVYACVTVASFVWVYRDAERRGRTGWIAALLVAGTWPPVSLAVWLSVRPEEQASS